MALVTLVDGPVDGTSVQVDSPALGHIVPVAAADWPGGAYVIEGRLPGYNAPVVAVWTTNVEAS